MVGTEVSATSTPSSTLTKRGRSSSWPPLTTMGYVKTSDTTRSSSSPSLFTRFSLKRSRSRPSRLSPHAVDGDQAGLGLLPMMSPFALPAISEQLLAPQQAPQQRSASWSELVAIFSGRSDSQHDVSANTSEEGKRKPKFTLGSPSDLDLSQMPSLAVPLARPHLLGRDARGNPTRRYTFAMAMTDEEITDEVLVEELERMRAVGAWSGSSDGDLKDFWDLHDSPGSDEDREMFLRTGVCSLPSFPVNASSARTALFDASDASWNTARRALLTCRECVRTERHYLTGMRALLSQETESPPPPLMLRHAERLVDMSERLLARMEENPNVWGVTAAFLGEEAGLEEGFMGWCSLVGGWFEGTVSVEDNKCRGRWKETTLQLPQQPPGPNGAPIQRSQSSKAKPGDDSARASLKRTMSGWRKSLPPLSVVEYFPSTPSASASSSSTSRFSSASTASTSTSAVTTPNSSTPSSAPNSKPTTPSASGTSSPTISFVTNSILHRKRDREINSTVQQNLVPTLSSGALGLSGASPGVAQNSTRRPPVRELAILPTQRVMRYVLLFRDLLAHTPTTSPSRVLIERAVDAAVRIADKCDRVQDHTAFQRSPAKTSSSSSTGHIRDSWSMRLSFIKSREPEVLGHRKAASENNCTLRAIVGASGITSPMPSRPASTCSQEHTPRVLVKPRR